VEGAGSSDRKLTNVCDVAVSGAVPCPLLVEMPAVGSCMVTVVWRGPPVISASTVRSYKDQLTILTFFSPLRSLGVGEWWNAGCLESLREEARPQW
jgi:hypothetical protein